MYAIMRLNTHLAAVSLTQGSALLAFLCRLGPGLGCFQLIPNVSPFCWPQ